MPEASEEVEAIGKHREQWSTEARGKQLARELVARGDAAADFPFLGRMIPEFQVENLREVLEQGFRVMYEVFLDRIEIFGVVHSRQDILQRD